MTNKGKLFKAYAEHVAHKYGFGTNKMVNLSADTLLRWSDYAAAEALRNELIADGYLREYETARRVKHGWSSHRDEYGVCWTGLTQKGWAIAHKYMGIVSKEEAETAVRNEYALDCAGTDCVPAFEEYRAEYIKNFRTGWWLLDS